MLLTVCTRLVGTKRSFGLLHLFSGDLMQFPRLPLSPDPPRGASRRSCKPRGQIVRGGQRPGKFS